MNKNMTTTLLVSAVLGVVLAFVAAAGAIALLPGSGPLATSAYNLVGSRGEDPVSVAMSLKATEPVNEAEVAGLGVAPSVVAEPSGDVAMSQEPLPAAPATSAATVETTTETPADVLTAARDALIAKVAQDGLVEIPAARAFLATLMPNN